MDRNNQHQYHQHKQDFQVDSHKLASIHFSCSIARENAILKIVKWRIHSIRQRPTGSVYGPPCATTAPTTLEHILHTSGIEAPCFIQPSVGILSVVFIDEHSLVAQSWMEDGMDILSS